MVLTHKQTYALDVLENDQVKELIFGGGAGGGKSVLGCYWILKMCFKYPGTRWLIGRAKLKTLKETTLQTLYEVMKIQGIDSDHYHYNDQKSIFTFRNGSQIFLKDLFFYPSDPNFDELGSLEITGAFIDEVNQIVHKAWDTVKSRIRYKLDDYGLIPKILGTCNPSKNWVYKQFYTVNKKGELEKHKAFIQSLVTDNENISKHYIDNLRSLKDKAQKARLLYGDWEYDDNPFALVNFESIQSIFTNEHVKNYSGRGKYITADIALQGSDKFVIGVWHGFELIEVQVIDKCEAPEVTAIIKALAFKHGVPLHRITYDSDGNGSFLRGYLAGAKPFTNNAAPMKVFSFKTLKAIKENYQNLKTQCYYLLAQLINDHKLFISCDLGKYQDTLIEELEVIESMPNNTDNKYRILPKDKIKEKIGRSPDLSDMLMMRLYFCLNKKVSALSDLKYFLQEN